MKISEEIQELIRSLSKIPGFGNRSAVRATIALISERENRLRPLLSALAQVDAAISPCPVCGNFDTVSPCGICKNPGRDNKILCIVEDISDLWAMERGNIFSGRYHILGGILSAIQGIEPADLNLSPLPARIRDEGVTEVILALPSTVDAKITSHYIKSLLEGTGVRITELASGIPLGGELSFLDEGTIEEALKGRKTI